MQSQFNKRSCYKRQQNKTCFHLYFKYKVKITFFQSVVVKINYHIVKQLLGTGDYKTVIGNRWTWMAYNAGVRLVDTFLLDPQVLGFYLAPCVDLAHVMKR